MYRGDSLATLGEAPVEPILAAARRTTDRTGQLLQRTVKHHTPVAKPPPGVAGEWVVARGRMPGTLRESWKVSDVTDDGGYRYRIAVLTHDPVAPHVEYPTRPHLIRPQGHLDTPRGRFLRGRGAPNALRFWDGGGVIHFALVVHHPGTQGTFMLARALVEVDGIWPDEIGREELDRALGEAQRLI